MSVLKNTGDLNIQAARAALIFCRTDYTVGGSLATLGMT